MVRLREVSKPSQSSAQQQLQHETYDDSGSDSDFEVEDTSSEEESEDDKSKESHKQNQKESSEEPERLEPVKLNIKRPAGEHNRKPTGRVKRPAPTEPWTDPNRDQNETFERNVKKSYKLLSDNLLVDEVESDRHHKLSTKSYLSMPKEEPSTGTNRFRVVTLKKNPKEKIDYYDFVVYCEYCECYYRGLRAGEYKRQHLKTMHPQHYVPRARSNK